MALEILDVKKDAKNFGLLSKIQIGGKTYELKDLIARENVESLSALLDALSAKVGNVAEGQNLADIIKNIQENAYDDTALQNAIKALQEADLLKADKDQVAADIKAAVKAEADIARAAEQANAAEIARVDNVLKAAIENDGAGLDSIKELASWIEDHDTDAAEMTAAITKNTEDIAKEAKAREDADKAIDERLNTIEAELGDGEGSVTEQIEAAKQAAITAANEYTDGEIDTVEAELAKKEDKANLKALAYKPSATGTVAGETISGVKATGTSTGSINVALTAGSETINSTGDYTPAGSVTGGKVTAAGTVTIAVTNADAQATLTTADYQPAGNVSVRPTTAEIQVVKNRGTAASFVEGEFTPAELKTKDITIAAHNHLEASVNDDDKECLVFTAPMVEALTFKAVDTFTGGSKAADSWTANIPAEVETKTVATGIDSASFTGSVATGLKVTGVTYQKHDSASATFTGSEVEVTGATFSGDAATIAVRGQGKTYAIDTENTKFNGAALELNVGDIAVAAKEVTVQ
jgi:hypothetical protein